MLAKKSKWMVRLGESEWMRHTYARTESDGLRLLGSVRRGIQVGALGVTEQGEYVQVVGDHMVALNRSQISRVLDSAQICARGNVRPMQRPSVSPVVIVKRRRVIVPP